MTYWAFEERVFVDKPIHESLSHSQEKSGKESGSHSYGHVPMKDVMRI
jgi:hypothetical protein